MVSKSEFIFSDPRSFRSRRENDLCLNSDIVKLLLKTSGWKKRSIFFLFWSALVIGGRGGEVGVS